MRKPKIRFSTLSDGPGVMEVIRQTTIGDHHIVDGAVEDLLLESVLVAELDNKIVGFLSWIQGRRHAYIDALAVLPEYQNACVGGFLMAELGNILDSLNLKYIYACTIPTGGEFVRAMLARLGYTSMGITFNMGKRIQGGGLRNDERMAS